MHEVAIVGAGLSGLGTAIKLRETGIDGFVLLERAQGVGSSGCATTSSTPATA